MKSIKEFLLGNKESDEVDELRKPLLDTYQSRCNGGSKKCELQFKLFKKTWCALDSRINYKCPHRIRAK